MKCPFFHFCSSGDMENFSCTSGYQENYCGLSREFKKDMQPMEADKLAIEESINGLDSEPGLIIKEKKWIKR
jgi:hypothetical protein